jgi:hypothetical protein
VSECLLVQKSLRPTYRPVLPPNRARNPCRSGTSGYPQYSSCCIKTSLG